MTSKLAKKLFAAFVVGLFSLSLAAQNDSNLVKFAVVGDVPYGKDALAKFPELVNSIENSAAEFVIHVGDIKGGSASCSDEMLSSRINAITEIQKPVIFIPGDNDWTDCHRRRAGSFEPLERLHLLRELAYPVVGESLGVPSKTVESQAQIAGFEEFPENQRWFENDVSFVALHLLGSANGMMTFRGRTEADQLEAERRIAAGIEWLDQSFAQAIDAESEAIVVAVHGNPFNLSASRASRYKPHPFSGFLASLRKGAANSNKPVLFIHGDTHDFKFDQPFSDEDENSAIANLYRLEGVGSPAIGWVEVTINPGLPENVFSVQPHFISEP